MAAPTFVAKGSFANGTAAITPSMPVGRAVDDVCLLFVESANQTITEPSGWTEAVTQIGTGTAGAAGGVRLACFYRVLDGSEGVTVTVADTGDHQTATILCFRGVDTTNPFNVTASSTQAATTSMSFPGVTTTVAECMIVHGCAVDTDAASTATSGTPTNANLTSLTERQDQSIANNTGGGLVVLTGVKDTAGATGDTTSTGSTSVARAYITVALQPGAPPPRTGDLAATESGADTFASDGDVVVQGALASTESGADTFAGAGPGGIRTGSMAVTETGGGGSGQFGNRVDGNDTFPQSDNRVLVSPFTLTETATITSIGTRCTGGAGGGGNWWGVIYADNAGVPSTRLAVTAARTFPAGPAEITGAVSPGVVLEPGTYWIGSASNSVYDAPWDHQTGSSTLKRGEGFSPTGDWPGGGSDYTSTLTAWAEYTTAGGDVFAASGTISSGANTGTLAATESGADTLVASGAPSYVGTMAATETTADQLAAVGGVLVQGAAAAAETTVDTAAGTGAVLVQGSMAAVETTADVFSSIGDVLVQGTLVVSETGADVFAATGAALYVGSMDAVESGADTLAATGAVLVRGTMAATETTADQLAATGAPSYVGTLSATETTADQLAAVGDVVVQGPLAVTEGTADTAAGAGAVVVQGAVAGTETTADTAAGAGTVLVRGALAAVEMGADTLAATGGPVIQGPMAAQETGADLAEVSGSVLVQGAAAAVESGTDIFSGAGAGFVSGILTVQEGGADTLAAAGVVLVQGALAAVEVGGDTFSGAGVLPLVGTMALYEVEVDTPSITGRVLVKGALVASEAGSDSYVGAGSVRISGAAAAVETTHDVFAASGVVPMTGIPVKVLVNGVWVSAVPHIMQNGVWEQVPAHVRIASSWP